MANIAKPKRKMNPKGDPPNANTNVNPLTRKPSGHAVPLNFTVENEFRREFKTFAAQNDIPMVDLLKRSFETYKQQVQI